MSLFRRQSDSSSDDSNSATDSTKGSHNDYSESPSANGPSGGEAGGSNGASASSGSHVGSISTSDMQSELSVGPGTRIDEHRDMMLASLLEDHFRAQAAEVLNAAHPGKNYTRQSPEVQPLAEELFKKTGHVFSSNHLLSSSSITSGHRETRRQYLAGLDSLAAGRLPPAAELLNPMYNLSIQPSNLSPLTRPANDLQLTVQASHGSHYLSNFMEIDLLGKGAFGKVFKCRNQLDQMTYAIKKIPLSPKVIRRFYEGRHDEMEELLREVKALAMLDHANVVRYHATWIEQPHHLPAHIGSQVTPESARAIKPGTGQGQLLIEDRPFNTGTNDEPSFSVGPEQSASYDDIVFGEDTPSDPVDAVSKEREVSRLQRSEYASSRQRVVELSSSDGDTSDIFTDGTGAVHSKHIGRPTDVSHDGTTHVLCIQMSLYPTTLAQYLAPPPSTPGNAALRHCYHLLPTLRLLLAILTGLQYIHAKGMIHRDIKPGNIFLSDPKAVFDNGYSDVSCYSCVGRDGEGVVDRWLNPRIGDFGLVTQLAREGLVDEASSCKSAANTQKPVGTAYYRPPVWRGGSEDSTSGSGSDEILNDEKVDIFALGVVFMEMLWRCGTAMERANMLKDLQKGILPSGLRQKLEAEGFESQVVEDVLTLGSVMVNPNPAERYSGKQVREAMEGLLGRISHNPK